MPALALQPGVTCAWRERGQGRPVVLLHGWAMTSGAFAAQLEALGDAHRAVAVDLRGHGASRCDPGAPLGLDDLAGDVAGLLDALDLRGALLAGWSMGAQVALAAARRVPGRVAGLALLAATPRFCAGPDWAHGLPGAAVRALASRVARGPRAALERFFDGMFAPGELSAEAVARLRPAALGDPYTSREVAEAGLRLLREVDLRPVLASVPQPALLVHGEADPICLPGASRALALALPRATRHVLPGVGHAPHLSRPERVSALLAAFARELPEA